MKNRPRSITLALLIAVQLPAPLLAQPVAPWSVPARVSIERRELSFENAGARLSGTLYTPRGARNLPVVIAFHGAGTPSRDHPLFDHLKTMLPPLGIAVFVYDRRGTGRSTGDDARKTDFDVLASDGVAAFRMLAVDRQVDPKRIGFWGLSQGGWLSLLAAAQEPRAAFAVSISAPMTGADIQMNYAVENIMRIKDYPQRDIDAALAARQTVDRYVRGKLDRASAVRADADARKQPWWRDAYLSGNIDDPTWLGQMNSNPLCALDQSQVSTLMIFGQADPWVPVARSLAALDATAARHPNVTVRLIEGADHAMMLGASPKSQIDPAAFARLAPDAPAYFGLLGSWLTGRVTAPSAARH